jgi:hypothetical protein
LCAMALADLHPRGYLGVRRFRAFLGRHRRFPCLCLSHPDAVKK